MTKPKHWTWFKFDWKAWRHDPLLRRCSKETRGFWIDCIAAMEELDTYFLEGTPEEICREVNATRGEFESSLMELERTGAATILRNDPKCQEIVKLVSRRILKAVSITEYNKIKQRESRLSRAGQLNVNQPLYKDKSFKEEELNNNVDKLSSIEGESEGKISERLEKKSVLPTTFRPTFKSIEWAKKNCPHVSVEETLEEFIDYWREEAMKNNKKTIRGWNQAWRRRMTFHEERRQGAKGNGINQGQRKTNLERIEETGRVIAQYPTEAELALAREAERNAQRSG